MWLAPAWPRVPVHLTLDAMPPSDLDLCSIASWYPALRRVTIRTSLIPLTPDFIRYLLSDRIFVPNPGEASSGADSSTDFDDDDASVEDADSAARFPELEKSIVAAIDRHGGGVLPKLNWSAPSDAAWVLGGSLKCASATDVLLLLKTSDRISHDLCDARRAYAAALPPESPAAGASDAPGGAEGGPFVLALRRWCNLKPQNEFRCFCTAHGATLVSACQRDRFSHYPFLVPARATLLRLLQAFVRANLGAAAAVALPERLVADLYVDAEEKVHLLDLAPFHEATDPLLFEWPELLRRADTVEAQERSASGSVVAQVKLRPGDAAGGGPLIKAAISVRRQATAPTDHRPELRLVETEHGVAPSAAIYYGWPEELRESGGGDVSSLLDAARKAASTNGG